MPPIAIKRVECERLMLSPVCCNVQQFQTKENSAAWSRQLLNLTTELLKYRLLLGIYYEACNYVYRKTCLACIATRTTPLNYKVENNYTLYNSCWTTLNMNLYKQYVHFLYFAFRQNYSLYMVYLKFYLRFYES